MIPLTLEQENEIDTAWHTAREQLNPFLGERERIDNATRAELDAVARSIGRKLSNMFYHYLTPPGERIEVTVGVDEILGLVAGWRAVRIPPLLTNSELAEVEDFLEEDEYSGEVR